MNLKIQKLLNLKQRNSEPFESWKDRVIDYWFKEALKEFLIKKINVIQVIDTNNLIEYFIEVLPNEKRYYQY